MERKGTKNVERIRVLLANRKYSLENGRLCLCFDGGFTCIGATRVASFGIDEEPIKMREACALVIELENDGKALMSLRVTFYTAGIACSHIG